MQEIGGERGTARRSLLGWRRLAIAPSARAGQRESGMRDALAYDGRGARTGRMHARALALAALLVLTTVANGVAQFPFGAPASRPIRLEGYWGRTPADPEVIGDVTISAAGGRPPRRFGVTALQAYQ